MGAPDDPTVTSDNLPDVQTPEVAEVPELQPVAAGITTSSFLLAVIALASSMLTAYFGHDFGLARNAQNLAAVGVFLVPGFYALSRAIQHAAHHKAVAQVAVARASLAQAQLENHAAVL